MKIKLLSILLCYCTLTQAQWIDRSFGTSLQDVNHSPNVMKRSGIVQTPRASYDVDYYCLRLEIDPAINYIKGSVSIYFQTKISGFQDILFDLYSKLNVDSVLYHHKRLAFTQNLDNTINIHLNQPLNNGIIDSVSIFYQGVPGSSGFGSFVQSTHQGVPIVWTLSEPYGASDWWPCKKELKYKADSIDIYIATPSQYRAVANGLLVDSTQQGNYKTYHWKHRYPIAHYLIAFAVTNYSSYYEKVLVPNGDTIKILNYVYPEYLAEAKTLSPYIIKVMQLYNQLFGIYPFSKEKYGHAQFGWGGGMENQTMTFVGSFSPDLLAHELAHHWFGDKVTCGTWRDIWLNEGFATYLTGITKEKLNPTTWNDWREMALKSATLNPCGSVYIDDTTNVSRIFSGSLSYNKGALVLHMLRWKLGDTTFFKGLRHYLTDTTLAYKTAITSNLQSHLEKISGQDLTSFFNKWVYNQGYPSYTVLWEQKENKTLAITLNQTTSCSESVSFFDMPVPVKVTGIGRDTTLILNHTFSGQQFSYKLGFTVTGISLDPDKWILSTQNEVFHLGSTVSYEFNAIVNPNPIKETTQIIVTQPLSVSSLSLKDIYGHNIMNIDKPFATGNNTLTLDLTGKPKGMYLLYLQSSFGVIVKKLILE